jgi:hypothetical protein
MFGTDQVIRDNTDEYRQWLLGQWSRHPRRIEVLPPAPPDDPAPEPSEAQHTYQAAYVAAQPGRSKTSRAAARRTAREAVSAAHGPAWLDAQGRPRRTLPRGAAAAGVVVEVYDTSDACSDIDGSWTGLRTQAARQLVRVKAARLVREAGLVAYAEEVRVRWDGTWTLPARDCATEIA